MSEAKHTPGPWLREGRQIVTDRGIICIAPNLPEGGVFDKEVNLNLIAAAPELLEACELTRNECIGLAAYLGTCAHDVIIDNLRSTIASLEGKVEMLSAAILKAKGQ